MASLFEWLSRLSPVQGILYFSLMAIIMAIIPYSSLIMAFLKHVVYSKEPAIHHFECIPAPHVFIGKDDKGRDVYVEMNGKDILISGTQMNLVWQVEGAYRVDLHPVKKWIKGNATTVLIDRDTTTFTLDIYGFFGKKVSATIQIPADEIYDVEVTSISSYHHLIRQAPAIQTTKLAATAITSTALTKQELNSPITWNRECLPEVKTNARKSHLNEALEKTKFLQGYSFSTSKYNKLFDKNKNNTHS